MVSGFLYVVQDQIVWAGQSYRTSMDSSMNREGGSVKPVSTEMIILSPEHLALHMKAAVSSNEKTKTKKSIVFFHGNTDQLGTICNFGKQFSERGFDFYAVEYPGYGLAAGTPSELSVNAASIALLSHLIGDRKLSNSDIILVGHSIGCAPALATAANGFGSAVVLICPFTSLQARASIIYPFFGFLYRAFPSILHDKLDNTANAQKLKNYPTLIVHGTADKAIPVSQSEELWKEFAPATSRLILFDGADHLGVVDNEEWASKLIDEITASFMAPEVQRSNKAK